MKTRKKLSQAMVFILLFGVVWFLGSWLLGVLYDRSIPVMIAVSVVTQLAAIPLYLGSASFRSMRE